MQIVRRRFAEPGVLWQNALEAQDLGFKRINMMFGE
jgi:hypothetical protein